MYLLPSSLTALVIYALITTTTTTLGAPFRVPLQGHDFGITLRQDNIPAVNIDAVLQSTINMLHQTRPSGSTLSPVSAPSMQSPSGPRSPLARIKDSITRYKAWKKARAEEADWRALYPELYRRPRSGDPLAKFRERARRRAREQERVAERVNVDGTQ